jgi:hypothetical protein
MADPRAEGPETPTTPSFTEDDLEARTTVESRKRTRSAMVVVWWRMTSFSMLISFHTSLVAIRPAGSDGAPGDQTQPECPPGTERESP